MPLFEDLHLELPMTEDLRHMAETRDALRRWFVNACSEMVPVVSVVAISILLSSVCMLW
jgi:hypothetical protein